MQYQTLWAAVNRNLHLLAPFVREKAQAAVLACNDAGYQVQVFEGYRTVSRQNTLYSQGRTVKGNIVTNSKGWQSWHQFGLAIDIAYCIDGKWSWEGDFDKPATFFKEAGFTWLAPFEKAHFQITGGISLDEAHRITVQQGTQALWIAVEKRLQTP